MSIVIHVCWHRWRPARSVNGKITSEYPEPMVCTRCGLSGFSWYDMVSSNVSRARGIPTVDLRRVA